MCVVVVPLVDVPLVLDVLVPDVVDAVVELAAAADALGVVVVVVPDALDAVDALDVVALAAATFELATVEVTPLWFRANAPPAPRNSSVLNAPVTRRAPRAG